MEDFLRKEKFLSRPDGMMMCTEDERRSENINKAAVKKRVRKSLQAAGPTQFTRPVMRFHKAGEPRWDRL